MENRKPKTLQDAVNDQVCIDTVAEVRWPDGVTCPACEHKEHYYLKTQKRWKCKECGRQFSVKLGTIFEDSPLGLDKWLVTLWMLVNCKNGVSSYEIHRAIGVTQKSAWFMLQRLRHALQSGSILKTGKLGGEGSEVEADETFIGGNLRKMHKERRDRYNHQRGAIGKAVVSGLLDRNKKQVRASVVPNTTRGILQDQVRRHVESGTNVYTDEALAYYGLDYDYVHQVVNHAKEYVSGRVHTNGLENFWSLLKRGLDGTYVSVEPFHLQRYVDEQVFRFNNRGTRENKVTDADRFGLALSQVSGKRLTFAEVTGKVGEAEAF
jgi:transposase-like protein